MSANGNPVDPFEFAQQGDFTDNFTYTVPASGEVQPYTATATFTNNSGQAIQPTISIYSAQGNLLSRTFPAEPVADGDNAEVTWMPPFGSAASSPSPSGSGIQFDTDNEGGWLEVTTNDQIPTGAFGGYSTVFNDNAGSLGSGNNGVWIQSQDSNILLESDNHDVSLVAGTIPLTASNLVSVQSGGDVNLTATHAFRVTNATLGFFGHNPNPQPAAPTTLGDVIAALQSLGLVA